ncbi:MAG: 4-hydroxybenzoate polyprenyltransferase [Peptococcaceae bacterium]|nr:4-hydroxybenzoate polyprenyltransferase [Peptococcaceae bacterium]
MALVRNKAKTFAELVKFEHTIFALPFAYMGALLAKKALPTWLQFIWITLAMVGARSAAMGLNRVIDRYIDKENPRTANRHLPRGLISVWEVMVFVVLSFLLLIYATYRLSPRHLIYLPVIILILTGYSYTKRFTWLCHLVLGIAIGFAPMGGWIGVTQSMQLETFILGLVVAFWIAGFDIIYATQDLEFDRQYGLYSMPVTFGLKKALFVAKLFHVVVVLLLVSLYSLLDLGWWYLAGVFVTNLLLHYEHSIISPQDLSRVNVAFFNINGLISIQLLVFTLLDVLL